MADLNFSARVAIPPAVRFKTIGHPLARSHTKWGVQFLGTKEELQAAGFGVGLMFPGEVGGNRKKAVLPACNGFLRIEVEIYGGCRWLGEPSQTVLPNYVISARYLADSCRAKRAFHPTQWPGVLLHHSIWGDVFKGRRDALIAAGFATHSQFPGMPNCGKVRTTFDSAGRRVSAGNAHSVKEGNRTVAASGQHFEVLIYTSAEEREIRRLRSCKEHEAEMNDREQRVSVMFSEYQARPPKRHLQLVWSV